MIPVSSARAIADLRQSELPIDEIAARTRATSHSTLGMIQVLRERLPASAAEHVYYGATVQDVSDTSHVLETRAVLSLIWRDLWDIEGGLLVLAERHRTTPMAGRTHGQPGSPISFGFKVATWLDEVGRHMQRLQQGRPRWLVGQLGGAVGTLSFFGDRAFDLRARFCAELDLAEPDIAWTSTRDRMAEVAHCLAMICSTLARIANEVYSLQRREIGELAERAAPGTVGSITMPHKRNPESSEQIVALARLVRAQSAVLTETMVQEHERDARGWKVEWAAFPELCQYALAATGMARTLVAGLEVEADTMRSNLGDWFFSERLLSAMSARLGKHVAQSTLQDIFARARAEGQSVAGLLRGFATAEELEMINDVELGAAPAMVDRVTHATRARRSAESEVWQDAPRGEEL